MKLSVSTETFINLAVCHVQETSQDVVVCSLNQFLRLVLFEQQLPSLFTAAVKNDTFASTV